MKSIAAAYFDLSGASAYTGGALSIRSLRRLISRPDGLPYIRIGQGKIMVKKADLDAFLEAHLHKPTDLNAIAVKVVREFVRGADPLA